MPGGPAPLGFGYFVAIKLVGYTGYCRWAIQPQLEYAYASTTSANAPRIPSAWKAGLLRTLVGVVIGAVVGLAFWKIPFFQHHDIFDNGVFFVLLVPVRVLEWWILLRWIYREQFLSTKTKTSLIIVGILVSFALDAIGVLAAFVLPGGVWVC